MTEFGGYKVHPSLARFPMMNERQLAQLAASIKQIGLIEPIVLAGKIHGHQLKTPEKQRAAKSNANEDFPPLLTGKVDREWNKTTMSQRRRPPLLLPVDRYGK